MGYGLRRVDGGVLRGEEPEFERLHATFGGKVEKGGVGEGRHDILVTEAGGGVRVRKVEMVYQEGGEKRIYTKTTLSISGWASELVQDGVIPPSL